MKTRTMRFILLLLLLTATGQLRAQNAVFIQQMINYPDLPGDTAYENVQYDFFISIFNGTNAMVTGTVTFDVRVDSLVSTIDTVPTQLTLNPGDTMVIPVIDYEFPTPQFKVGNNIVVVWPAINSGASVIIDSLITQVHFVPFSGIDEPSEPQPEIGIFPNPAKDFIEWLPLNGENPERVRIYDAKGRLVLEKEQTSRVAITLLPPGVYFVELQYGHLFARERFMKD